MWMQFQDIQKRKVKQGDDNNEDFVITESSNEDQDGQPLLVEKNSEIQPNSYNNSELRRAENDKSLIEQNLSSSLIVQKNSGVIHDLFDLKAKKRQSKQAGTIN